MKGASVQCFAPPPSHHDLRRQRPALPQLPRQQGRRLETGDCELQRASHTADSNLRWPITNAFAASLLQDSEPLWCYSEGAIGLVRCSNLCAT